MFRNNVRGGGLHMRKQNNRISDRANESLNKREAVLRRQRKLIAIIVVVFVSLGILLGTSINALASSKADVASYYKYYKCIRIEAGDTLWNIADEYIADLNIDKKDYIAEICTLNGICEDDIYAGDCIVVAYYSQDIK